MCKTQIRIVHLKNILLWTGFIKPQTLIRINSALIIAVGSQLVKREIFEFSIWSNVRICIQTMGGECLKFPLNDRSWIRMFEVSRISFFKKKIGHLSPFYPFYSPIRRTLHPLVSISSPSLSPKTLCVCVCVRERERERERIEKEREGKENEEES
jgi:hypothetical protein